MSAVPVIYRELAVASRRRGTWILRLIFGLGFGAAYGTSLFWDRSAGQTSGQLAFSWLAVTGFILCLAAGPYLTADTISSEKREGTLGLLFLTPLSGLQIVVGKMATHSLQVAFALLGTFPFLFLPVLLGGVLWAEVLRMVLVLLIALFVSLAVGILWSTLTDESRHAAMGTLVTILLLLFLPWLWTFLRALVHGGSITMAGPPQASPMVMLMTAFESRYSMPTGRGLGNASGSALFWVSSAIQALLGLVLVLAAGVRLPLIWRQSGSSAKEHACQAPNIPTRSAKSPRTQFDTKEASNGIRSSPAPDLLWLASRSLEEGGPFNLTRIVFLLFFYSMLIVGVSTSRWQEGFVAALFTALGLHTLARVQASWRATRWFHREWRSGALELLLTTPIEETAILAAHHDSLRRALRRSVRPLLYLNVSLLMATHLFWEHLHMDDEAAFLFSTFFIGGGLVTIADFAAIRWLGLRESLRQPTQARAAGRVFASLSLPAWIALGLIVVALSNGVNAREAGYLFIAWYAGCLLFDGFLVRSCRRWANQGIRSLIAEK